MVDDRENFLVNRSMLADWIGRMTDRLSESVAQRAFDVLVPLARGRIDEPTTRPNAAQMSDPLNPFQFGTGEPAELRGAALLAIARVLAQLPATYRRRFDGVLEEALSATESEVRRLAFAAAREVPKLSRPALMAVMQGMRDADANAAASAFASLATKSDLRLSRSQWHLFTYAARMASHSSVSELRATAAAALANLASRDSNRAARAALRNCSKSLPRIFAPRYVVPPSLPRRRLFERRTRRS